MLGRRIIIAALAAAALFTLPAAAATTSLTPAEVRALKALLDKPAPPAPAPQAAPTPVVDAPAPPPPPPPAVVSTKPAPAVTQNTVTTTGPVSSETTISAGTLAGEVLKWAALAFGSVISSALTAFIIRLLRNAGIQGTELLSDKLNSVILNGMNLGASKLADRMQGMGQVEIKNAIAAEAVTYAQTHGGDIIKRLGLDPTSGKAVEAIKARIETAIADPNVPTPAVLDPAKTAAPAADAAAAPARV